MTWSATTEKSAARQAVTPAQTLLILLAALLSLCIQMVAIHAGVGMGPGFEAVSISRSMVEHGTFAEPYDVPSGPTAHIAPLYPAILAAIRLLTPDVVQFRFVSLGLTMFLHLVNVLMVFVLATELFGAGAARKFALGAMLVLPLYQVIPAGDAIYVAAGVPGFWLLVRRRKVVLSGILAGLLLLCNPSVLIIVVTLAIFEWRATKPVAMFLVVLGLVILPWEIRNYRTFHKWFFIRDNLGMELDLFNNDCLVRSGTPCVPHPMYSADERQIIADIGEVPYNQMRMQRAVAWMKTHPADEFRLARRRAAAYWFPIAGPKPYGWSITLLTIVSLWGLWCLLRDRHPLGWVMLVLSVIYPPLYYFIRLDLRFRDPILWITVLAAAYGIAAWNSGAGASRARG